MSILPKFDDEELKLEVSEETPPTSPQPSENEGEEEVEVEEVEEVEEEKKPVKKADELFDMPNYDEEGEKPKGRKKRKPLSEETKAKLRISLQKAREKSKIKRQQLKEARLKKEAEEKAIRKAHIKKRKAKKQQQEAELEVLAESNLIQKENDLWNEERITSLMNKTLDSYFQKRQEEKKKREHFQMPAQNNYNYMPNIPPQSQRAIPKPPPPPRQPQNPYASMFGLTQDDYDDYYKK